MSSSYASLLAAGSVAGLRLLAAAALLGLGVACEGIDENDGPFPVEGSSYRLKPEKDQEKNNGKFVVGIFKDRADCSSASYVAQGEIDACVPMVDRGSGQVRVAFRALENNRPSAQSYNKNNVRVAFDGQTPSSFKLVPHGDAKAGELFIIIVDGSKSIFVPHGDRDPGIGKVEEALLNEEVVNAFLPENATSGVILLKFSSALTGFDGKTDFLDASNIITDQKSYLATVKRDVRAKGKGGWSYMYDSIEEATTKLIESKPVQKFLKTKNATPKIIVLTDGFNDERHEDTCATNVPKLSALTDKLKQIKVSGHAGYKPKIYTIGLGEELFTQFEMPQSGEVSQQAVCYSGSQDWSSDIIDGHLEQYIDNASLEYIAAAAGGESVITDSSEGLAEMFLKAANKKYTWYEVWIRSDSVFHRRHFQARIQVTEPTAAQAAVSLWPGGWVDPPGAIADADPKVPGFVPTTFLRTFVFVATSLGVLGALGFVGPAMFNLRRALFRRAR